MKLIAIHSLLIKLDVTLACYASGTLEQHVLHRYYQPAVVASVLTTRLPALNDLFVEKR
ncbi:MAG: hypothetical protein ACXV2D_03815 [Halobacteriota archaeon]